MPGSLLDVLTGRQDAASGAVAQASPDTRAAALHRDLLAWYAAERRDLPWRRTRDPWAIWVSEIMLQQTRVDTVIPYYERFMARFPTPLALAEAPEGDVLAAWSGLGYYRRARMLHAGARAAADRRGVPRTREALLELPGIGRYTAGAIASIAFEERVGLVDGNVARVLARVFALDDDMRRAGMKRAEAIAEALVPGHAPGDWNQALMELGATVCTPRAPACERCPIAASCRARAEGRVGELPVMSEKPRPKPQRVQALVVCDRRGRVLLARRRSGGLFGGLWEPPLLDGGDAALTELRRRLSVKASERAGVIVHVLSHRRLTVDVHAGVLGPGARDLPESYEEARLFEPAAIEELGVSKLARKILAAVREPPPRTRGRSRPPPRRARDNR